jgi:uncharacterized membrane protein YbhN (UPF0104 family)
LGTQEEAIQLPGAHQSEAEAASPRRGRHVVKRVIALASLVAVGFVAWGARSELADAVDVIGSITPAVLVAGLLLEAGAVAALAQVYRASLEATGQQISYPQGLQVSMGAFTLSRALPGGGAAGAVWAASRLRQYGVRQTQAAAGVVIEGLLAMVTLGGIVTFGAVAALFRGRVTTGGVVAACAVPAVFALLAWVGFAGIRSPAMRHRFFNLLRKLPGTRGRADRWEVAADDLAQALAAGEGFVPVIGWSALNWGLDILALWLVFLGLGVHLEVGVLILGFGVANLVTALPHTPGGLGLVEAGMTGTYVALGTDTAVALAAVLAYRVISFWVPVLVGVPQYLRPPVVGE